MAASSVSAQVFRNIHSLSRSNLLQCAAQRLYRRVMSSNATETISKEPEKEDATEPVQNDVKAELAKMEASFKEEKAKLSEELEDLRDKYKRSLAETENVRTRMKKQVDDAKLFGIQGFCKDLLEVADILNKATETVPKELLQKNLHLHDLYKGLVMTDTQLQKLFVKNGLVKINPAEGEKFNPNIHEALFQQSVAGKEEDTVAVVTKIGYLLHHRTLRPALVGVYK